MSTSCFASDKCQPPETPAIDNIKKRLIDELGEQRNNDVKVTINNIIIMQAYKKKDYVLVAYKYDCCFEGGIVLYRDHEGALEEITYFNGYAENGAFIGYGKKNVTKHFKKYLPAAAKPILDCYQHPQK